GVTVLRLRELFDRSYSRLIEWLERLGVPRRWPPFLILGIAAALTSVILAGVGWIHGRTGAGDPPIGILPAAALKDGAAVVNAESAQLRSIEMVTRDRWAAGWAECASGPQCRYAAVVDRDGVKATAPEWPVPYVTLRTGDEAIAVAPPVEGTLTGDATLLFRLTYDGSVTSRLQYRLPTRTFQSGEILTDRIVPGRIVVVNLEESTVRMLETPATRSPVCDGGRRCWALTGIGRTDIVWTDDGGTTWGSVPLDRRNQRGQLAVSPDGRTLVATAVTIGDQLETVASMRISTDRGAHWTTVQHAPWSLKAAPVVSDDGTVVLVGAQSGDPRLRLFRITDGAAALADGSPGGLAHLSGDAKLIYGPEISRRRATQAAISTDQGTTWTKFTPR
ncbi:MAG TPA: sialidase family protein, partial [Kribbella sp.]|nr:sialidase family protein [Kribbella sp.]